MITFVPFGLPESTGRGPACAAISSHDRIALMTSADPPTRPNSSRNVRRVRAPAPSLPDCFSVMSLPLPSKPNLELHRARIPASGRVLSERRRAELRLQRGEERVVEQVQHVRPYRDGSTADRLYLLDTQVHVALARRAEVRERSRRVAEGECRRRRERGRVDPVVQPIVERAGRRERLARNHVRTLRAAKEPRVVRGLPDADRKAVLEARGHG